MFPPFSPKGLCTSTNQRQVTSMDAEDIPFQILREITDGFSEERKLGQGAFGVVYKVKLSRLAFSLWTNRYSQQIWPAQC